MTIRTDRRAAWRRRKAAAEATREILVERFPRCFMPKSGKKLPLKVGIYHDLRAVVTDIPARRLNAALHDYTAGRTYLRALVGGAHRVDLDGFPAGIVSSDEASAARERMRQFHPSKQHIPARAEVGGHIDA